LLVHKAHFALYPSKQAAAMRAPLPKIALGQLATPSIRAELANLSKVRALYNKTFTDLYVTSFEDRLL
jgi:hypothetical protein